MRGYKVNIFPTSLIKSAHDFSGWKSPLLSQDARLVLIQSVNAAIPTYAMQSCRLPLKTIQILKRINREFFLGDTDQKSKLHSIAWATIC